MPLPKETESVRAWTLCALESPASGADRTEGTGRRAAGILHPGSDSPEPSVHATFKTAALNPPGRAQDQGSLDSGSFPTRQGKFTTQQQVSTSVWGGLTSRGTWGLRASTRGGQQPGAVAQGRGGFCHLPWDRKAEGPSACVDDAFPGRRAKAGPLLAFLLINWKTMSPKSHHLLQTTAPRLRKLGGGLRPRRSSCSPLVFRAPRLPSSSRPPSEATLTRLLRRLHACLSPPRVRVQRAPQTSAVSGVPTPAGAGGATWGWCSSLTPGSKA